MTSRVAIPLSTCRRGLKASHLSLSLSVSLCLSVALVLLCRVEVQSMADDARRRLPQVLQPEPDYYVGGQQVRSGSKARGITRGGRGVCAKEWAVLSRGVCQDGTECGGGIFGDKQEDLRVD